MNIHVVIIMVLFLSVTIGVGIYFSKRTKNSNEYWVGSNVGPWVTAISYVGTYYSTVALVGGPSSTYQYGLGYGIWQVAGTTWLFGLLPFLIMAVPMKKMSSRLGTVTVPGWLSARYGSDMIKLVSGALVAILMIPYGTTIIKATGVLMETIAGIPYFWGITICTLAVAAYMYCAGYLAVVTNDTIQGWIMLVGALLIVPIAMTKVGGVSGLLTKLHEIDPKLLEIPGNLKPLNFISLAFVWGLICWGQPQLLSRFYSIRSSRDLGVTMVVVCVFTTLMASGFHANGLLARAIYGNQFMTATDQVIPTLATEMLPEFLAAIFIAAALSASLSTLSSTGLVAGSAVAKDIYEDIICKKAGKRLDEKRSLSFSKRCTLVTVLISYVFAIWAPAGVFTLATLSQGTIAACFTGTILWSVYWKRGTKEGCLVSMISGIVTTLVWYIIGQPFCHPYLPGVVVSIITFPIASLLSPKPDPALVAKAFGLKPSLEK